MERRSIIGGISVDDLAPAEVIAERMRAYTMTMDEFGQAWGAIAEALRAANSPAASDTPPSQPQTDPQ